MEITVFTLPTCPTCPLAKKIVAQVAQKYKIAYHEVDLSTSEGKRKGLIYQVMSTPSIAIDNEVIVQGKLISMESLENEVKKRL